MVPSWMNTSYPHPSITAQGPCGFHGLAWKLSTPTTKPLSKPWTKRSAFPVPWRDWWSSSSLGSTEARRKSFAQRVWGGPSNAGNGWKILGIWCISLPQRPCSVTSELIIVSCWWCPYLASADVTGVGDAIGDWEWAVEWTVELHTALGCWCMEFPTALGCWFIPSVLAKVKGPLVQGSRCNEEAQF